jgi:anti-sigma factor RsiW
MENGHPTDKELSQFARFELSRDDAQAVSQHLRTCSECNEQYRHKHEGRPGAPPAPLYNAAHRDSSSLSE